MVNLTLTRTEDYSRIKLFMISDEIWETFCDDLSAKDRYLPSAAGVWLEIFIDGAGVGMALVENDNLSTLRLHPYLLKKYRKCIRLFFKRFFAMFNETPDIINKLVVTIPFHRKIVYNTAKKVGFIDEGVNRASFLKCGKFLDQWDLGLTKEDIKGLKWLN